MPPHPTQVAPLKKMTKLVNDFLSRPDSGPFREPVDWRGLELHDYPKIIEKMMDLGTVKRKLERKQYYSAHQCAKDIKLIWFNCMTYNADGSDFWLLAKSFARRFDDRYRQIRKEFDCGQDLPLPHDDGSIPAADTTTTVEKRSVSRTSSHGDVGHREHSSSRAGSRTASRASSPTHQSGRGSATNSPDDAAGGAAKSPSEDDYADDDDDAASRSPSSSPAPSASEREMVKPTYTPPKKYTLDAKAKFGANLFLLSGVELAHVITTLEQQCPEALEHLVEDDCPDPLGSAAKNNDNENAGNSTDHNGRSTNASTDDNNNDDTNDTNANKRSPFVTPFHPATAKLEINVDNIEPGLLAELVVYVSDKVGTKVVDVDESMAARLPPKKKKKT